MGVSLREVTADRELTIAPGGSGWHDPAKNLARRLASCRDMTAARSKKLCFAVTRQPVALARRR